MPGTGFSGLLPSLPSAWGAQSHGLLGARSSDGDLGEGKCQWQEDRSLCKEVSGEAGAAFESFFSSAVQRRQLGWWQNISKELV